MGAYLDTVPFSGIIRIRDMMYGVANPFRLDQGDVSFDTPDTVKRGMLDAIAGNHSHYLQTTGLPRLRELIADKLRSRNGSRSRAQTSAGDHGRRARALFGVPGVARHRRRGHHPDPTWRRW